jgi:hypothetical protein
MTVSLGVIAELARQFLPSVVTIVDDQEEMLDLFGKMLPEIESLFRKQDIYQLTPMQLIDYCLTGHYTLWKGERSGELQAIAITGISDWPSGIRTFDVNYVIGRDGEFDGMTVGWDAFIDLARKNNCTRIVGYCRPGWRRHLRHLGIDSHRLIISKEL